MSPAKSDKPTVFKVCIEGVVVIPKLRELKHFAQRCIGFMGQCASRHDMALYLPNCRAVHTCFMRFQLDLIFVDERHRVVRVVSRVVPWRCILGGGESRGVIEIPAERINLDPFMPGVRLEFEPG